MSRENRKITPQSFVPVLTRDASAICLIGTPFPIPIDWTIILTSLEKIQVAAMQNMQWLMFYRD